ncbi:MAG: sel1 repeat family protein [Alphaproteobacteria bacterium]|nr:sel1 repeat family protein [Alphaproteobacteria bacterium]
MRKSLFIIFSLLFSSSTPTFSIDDEKKSTAPVVAGSSHLDPTIDEEIQLVVESRLLSQGVSKRSPRDQLDAPITVKFSSKEERAWVQTNIGTLYCNSINMKNFTEAMRWFKKAAAQKYAEAQFSIGVLHDYGLGVPPNHTKAMKWYLRAAAQKHAGALYSIGVLCEMGLGVPPDPAVAMEWYLRAAAQNHASAQNNIGFLYAKGEGVPQDNNEAMIWFQKAADQGNELAKENIKRLKGRPRSVRFIPGLSLWR